MKKLFACIWILVLCLSLLLYSIFDRSAPVPTATADEALPDQTTWNGVHQKESGTKLYFLNGQPVLQLIWDQLTAEFAQQTGIYITTVSSSENLQGETPTLFSVSHPRELGQWGCLDLSDTVAYANLASADFTIRKNNEIWGIASEAEPFGLIYNTTLLAQLGYTGNDIRSFRDLELLIQLIQDRSKQLSFDAFAQPDQAERFAAILSALSEDIRPFWDLYSSHMGKGTLSEGTALFQLGTLADMMRLSAGGKLQLQMLPLYTGAPGEEGRGLSCFGKHYWCIREDAPEEEITAALAFLNFLISPRADGTIPVDDLGILSPYRQATYTGNTVAQQLRQDIATGKALTVYGAEPQHISGYAQALLTYAADPTGENWLAVLESKNSLPPA